MLRSKDILLTIRNLTVSSEGAWLWVGQMKLKLLIVKENKVKLIIALCTELISIESRLLLNCLQLKYGDLFISEDMNRNNFFYVFTR